jgi:AraC family transcriptional regulator
MATRCDFALSATWEKLLSSRMTQRSPETTDIASGHGWRLLEITCHASRGDPVFEEQHDQFLIAIVKSGTFTYHGENGRHRLHAGALLLGNQGSCYCCHHHEGDGDQCMALQLDEGLFEDIVSSTGATRVHFSASSILISRALLPVLAQFERAATDKDPDGLEQSALEFAASVTRFMANPSRRANTSPTHRRRVESTLKAIERNLDVDAATTMRLHDLAEHASMSPYHFLRIFRQTTGTTPHQYILASRLRRAARQLQSSNKPVTEIAFDCGFNDLSTFNRTFKSTYGKSPGQARA